LYFYDESTDVQLIDKLLCCSYMFCHYCVFFRELVFLYLLSYRSMLIQPWWYIPRNY